MSHRLDRALLACGVVGPPLFVVVFLLEGLFAPRGYSVLRHPVSSFAIGPVGWVQVVSFLATGALVLAFAFALRQRLALAVAILVGLVGVGLIGSGIFVTDPVNGYPPGSPLVPDVRTFHGLLHDLFGTPVFLGLPVVCVLVAFRLRRGWAIYSVATAVAFVGCFVLTSMGLSQVAGLPSVAGLLQRVTIVVGWSWLTVLAVWLYRRDSVGRRATRRGDRR